MKTYFLFLVGRLRRLFFMQLPEDDIDREKSKKVFFLEPVFSSSISSIAGGNYLTALINHLGIPDALNGLLSSVVNLTCISQLFGGILGAKLKKVKLYVSSSALVFRVILGLLFFIPLTKLSQDTKIVLFVFLYISAYFIGNAFNPAAQNWVNSLLYDSERGNFYSKREILSIITSVLASFIVSLLFDAGKISGNMNPIFAICSVLVVTLTLIDFILYLLIKEPRQGIINQDNKELHGRIIKRTDGALADSGMTLKENFIYIFKNKKSRNVLFLLIGWGLRSFSTGFNTVYYINTLNVSFVYLSMLDLVAVVIRIFSTNFMQKMSVKYSWGRIFSIGMFISIISNALIIFMNKSNCYILIMMIYWTNSIAAPLVSIGSLNVKINAVSFKDKTLYFGIVDSIVGVASFLAVTVGAVCFDYLKVSLPAFQPIQSMTLLVTVWTFALVFIFNRKLKFDK